VVVVVEALPLTPAASTRPRCSAVTAFAFDAGSSEVYVADGLRNRRVAVVDMNTGAIKRFFGAYGAAPDDAAPSAYSANDPPSKQEKRP
jgi:DNA-binding beta-propeller fold protein YncE